MTLDDEATMREEMDRDLCLKVRKPELKRTGECHWCGEATEWVYCGPDCMADHEQHMRFNQ